MRVFRLFAFAILLCCTGFAQGVITTIAGTDFVFNGDGKPALAVSISTPTQLAVGPRDEIYFTDPDKNVVLKITGSGILNTVAGNGIPGSFGDRGSAIDAALNAPSGVVFDNAGILYVSEAKGNRIRRITPDGIITTIAGSGKPANGIGDGGPAANAALNQPTGLALDNRGNLYIADTGNHRVRRIALATGVINTVAGSGQIDLSGDGRPATEAAVHSPIALLLDGPGNLFISEFGNNRIRKVNLAGIIGTVAGNGTKATSPDGTPILKTTLNGPEGMVLDSLTGDILVCESGSHMVRRFSPLPDGVLVTQTGTVADSSSGDGGPAKSGSFRTPSGIIFDSGRNYYISDRDANKIRKISFAGIITTVAGRDGADIGDGGLALSALLNYPTDVVTDNAGNLYIADYGNNRIRKISSDGAISTLAGTGVKGFAGDEGPATAALLNGPRSLAAVGGTIFFSDSNNNRIRRVSTNGRITTIAGTGVGDFSGDGGPALAAHFKDPRGLAVDSAGNVFVADSGNNRVRRFSPGGVISSVDWIESVQPLTRRADFAYPTDVILDNAANLYVVERGDARGIGLNGGHRILKITLNGTISTVAGSGFAGDSGDGGLASRAFLSSPDAIALDSFGNLFVAEYGNEKIRKISNQGTITTVAGTGEAGYTGDGGAATQATFRFPRVLRQALGGTDRLFNSDPSCIVSPAQCHSDGVASVIVDNMGILYFADTGNNRIRAVLPSPPRLMISRSEFQINATGGGAPPPDQNLTVSSEITGVAFSLAINDDDKAGPWLRVNRNTGFTPATLQFSIDTTGLAPGTYRKSVTVAAALAFPPTATVRFTITIPTPRPPRLDIREPGIKFSFVTGTGASTRRVYVSNSGEGAAAYGVAVATVSGGKWLSVDPVTGSATAVASSSFVVRADPTALAAGTYSGSVTVTNTATPTDTVQIPVTMLVNPAKRIIFLSQRGLQFTSVVEGGVEQPQSVGVFNAGVGPMNWTAESSVLGGAANWIQISPRNGVSISPAVDFPTITIGVNQAALPQAPGEYYGVVKVSVPEADNSPQSISVVVNVLPKGSTPGSAVRPTGLIFVSSPEIGNPGSQPVSVGNLSSSPITYNSSALTDDDKRWFLLQPATGSVDVNQQGKIIVQPTLSGLSPGFRQGVVTILFKDGSVRTVSVLSVVVPGAPAFSAGERLANGCVPKELRVVFTSLRDGFNELAFQPLNLEVKAVDDCGNLLTTGAQGATIVARFSNGDPPVTLAYVGNGTWSATWQPRNTDAPMVTVVIAALGFQDGVRFSGESRLTGSLRLGSKTPLITPGSVLNGASFASDVPVAPGSLISVFGSRLGDGQQIANGVPLQTSLGGTQVQLGDRNLPLLYTSEGQVNAQVPFDLSANTQYQIVVRRGDAQSVPEPIAVAAAQPAVFTADNSGKGVGVITLPNGVAADSSNPAKSGDTVVIYCTGLGLVDPPVPIGFAATGLARTVNAVTVTIGGREASVAYAGLTPGFPGLYQINAVVPAGVSASSNVPVVVSVAGQVSPIVTMAVR